MMLAAMKLADVKDRTEPFTDDGKIQIDHVTEKVLPMLSAGGGWIAPGPSPLSTEETIDTFKVIVAHRNYQGQTLRCPDAEGCWISYDPPNGIVTIEQGL